MNTLQRTKLHTVVRAQGSTFSFREQGRAPFARLKAQMYIPISPTTVSGRRSPSCRGQLYHNYMYLVSFQLAFVLYLVCHRIVICSTVATVYTPYLCIPSRYTPPLTSAKGYMYYGRCFVYRVSAQPITPDSIRRLGTPINVVDTLSVCTCGNSDQCASPA